MMGLLVHSLTLSSLLLLLMVVAVQDCLSQTCDELTPPNI